MADHKRRKTGLLDDEEDAGATDFGIRVNKDFAARFEHNKRREELHRLQAKYPEEAAKLARKMAREDAIAAGKAPPPRHEDDEDSSEYESEDDGQIPEETEAKIFDTLLRIRSKDPSIYQKDVVFFQEEDEGAEDEGAEGEGGKKKGRKEKPMFLKDMIAKQALEYGAGGSSDEEEEGAGGRKAGARHPKAYDPEQEAMRRAFLEAVEDVDGEGGEEDLGGVLRKRAGGKNGRGEADEEEEEEGGEEEGEEEAPKKKKKKKKEGKDAKGKQGGKGEKFQHLIEQYFGGPGGGGDKDDSFLKEYILNKGWVDRDDEYVPSYAEVVGADDDGLGGGVDDEEDETYLRQMDAFEAKYNFRYEEPGADRIITHPRQVEGTVRKPDDRRKRQRDAKKARQEEAEAQAQGELKRLKNLKKAEIESKLGKLRDVAGAAAPAAASLDDVLEGDFDPEEWDKKMAAAFNDDYYDAEEELEGLQEDLDLLASGGEDSEDDLLGPGVGSEGEEGGEEGGKGGVRFATLRKKIKEVDRLASEEPEGADAEGETEDEGDAEEGEGEGGKPRMKARKDSSALAAQRAQLQRLLEEYYRLDYEDSVGGVKTRFRYKEVPSNTFGLSVDEILRLDDKSLNQVVGMKRLAPYREDLDRLRPNYKALAAVKGEAADKFGKQRRQQNKKQGWQDKAGPRQGGQWWGGGEGGAAAGGDGAAAGAGPGSAADADAKPSRPHADAPGQGKGEDRRRKDRPAGEAQAGPGPGSAGERKGKDKSQAAAAAGEHGGKGKGGAGAGRGERGPAHGQGHKEHKEHKERKEHKPLDPQAARLASFAVPTLKKDQYHGGGGGAGGGGKSAGGAGGVKRKRGGEAQQAQQTQQSDGPQLSRAQKKNMKRSAKRAEKKGKDSGAGSAGAE
ncbi:hypothetical protein HYH03_000967 [Edaphochlamys debaryana]|uniref:Kri1-like C-terminal domain-containing protein n=1 Tax=Edaphochlamys debaryana TaxID=47281 RepID=A0A835YDY6_9CHLO|nr:hypothetical protein HYH03_000967 [Edaphochlamys debaryana]|eukprot:KAG2501152.1 hypothetical protein HYH03_000967 [Edaphochlamys debaryana]